MKNERSHIRKAVRSILARNARTLSPKGVSVGWPVYDHREIMGAIDALLELRISQGSRVKQFEEQCARYVGVKYAVAVNSGSSANLLALTALMQAGRISRGDEVILPATTFATVASPVIQLGLVPVYVDVDAYSWNLDPVAVDKAITKKTRLIIAVHTFGNPADMKAIMRIAFKRKLIVLEDSCEAHGAKVGKKVVGSMGHISTLSFFVAHNITTGEGGMVFTNDRRYAELVRSLREFGRLIATSDRLSYKDKKLGVYDTRYVFTRLGYNMRMTDIEAALGIAQLKKLDALNAKRLMIVNRYTEALSRYRAYVRLPTVAPGAYHSFYGYPIAIEKSAPFSRQELAKFLESRGIETRPFFGGSLPDQPGFRNERKRVAGKLPVASWLRDNGLFIGCHPALSAEHVQTVLTAFRDFFQTKLPQ